MARMIPPVVGKDAPPGEVEVFRRLVECPGTDDWVVLHSLNIARHVRQAQGEADFFILVPGEGMLLLEIKSHRSCSRDADGLWHLGNDSPTRRSPFTQASDNMHSVRKYMIDRNVDLSGTLVCSAVWFTNVRARALLPDTLEWHRWQILDSQDLKGDVRSAVLSVLSRAGQHLRDTRGPGMVQEGRPSAATCDAAQRALRPRFDVVLGVAAEKKMRQAELLRLLDEQYEALDQVQENRAVLMVGPAGSGKTLIGLEAARRSEQLNRSAWFLCYNRQLGRMLEDSTESLAGVTGTTFHRLALRIANLPVPPLSTAAFWDIELPMAAAMELLEGDDWKRDFLIVDEAQDLLREPVLDVLDLLVHGGLAGGRCLFLGDFERQALYGCEDGRGSLALRARDLARFTLTANCRNLPRIGHAVEQLSGMRPGYSRFRRMDDGEEPRFHWLSAPSGSAEADEALASCIRGLTDDGYQFDDIVVLSPVRDSLAELAADPWLRQVLVPLDEAGKRRGRVRYATVHAFKGLESDAVIVTDLNDSSAPGFDSLLYVALTRARDRLHIIAPKDVIGQVYLGRSSE